MNPKKISIAQRVNTTAIFSYGLLDFILIACYFLEVFKNSRTVTYFAIFTFLALCPFIASIILFVKNKEEKRIKYSMSIGFLIFYAFIIFTTISPVAFVYAIIIAVILLGYNNNRLTFFYMSCVTLINIIQTAYLAATHMIDKADLPNIEIRVASLILFTLFMTLSTKVANQANQDQMDQIREEQEKTSTLMEQILRISKQMTENISTVADKMNLLSETATKTKVSMEEVNQGTGETVNSIQMQMEKTSEIDQSIHQVNNATRVITENIDATQREIISSKENIDNLIHHVELSNESNQNVSKEIEELNAYTGKMQSIIDMINGVTNQTSLLALNASIEAARAGEAGKGFAVVASEISNLATQTQSATVSITEMIQNVSNKLASMVNVVEDMLHNSNEQNEVANNTAHSFEELSVKVKAVYHEVKNLDRLVSELNNANAQVIHGIETISAATEEVTAHSSQTLETSEVNNHITNEVDSLVEALSQLADELQAVES